MLRAPSSKRQTNFATSTIFLNGRKSGTRSWNFLFLEFSCGIDRSWPDQQLILIRRVALFPTLAPTYWGCTWLDCVCPSPSSMIVFRYTEAFVDIVAVSVCERVICPCTIQPLVSCSNLESNIAGLLYIYSIYCPDVQRISLEVWGYFDWTFVIFLYGNFQWCSMPKE